MPFTLHDLGLAFRRAKMDLFYSTSRRVEDVAAYEDNLHDNLRRLLVRLNGPQTGWSKSQTFVGGYTYAPKSVALPDACGNGAKANGCIISSPHQQWKAIRELTADPSGSNPKPEAEFRVMENCTISFHVLSSLWMLKVGHLFDATLDTCAYGNRLARVADGRVSGANSLGSFTPYFHPFRTWRNNGINAIQSALSHGKSVVALTADVDSFYHELHADFMLDRDFLKNRPTVTLSPEQTKLNELFIHALQAWAMYSPLKKGLPVGLPASAIIANMALADLDQLMLQQIVPLFYGRYVDDVMLVMENRPGHSTSRDVWEWIFARSRGQMSWTKDDSDRVAAFQPSYFKRDGRRSEIRFSNSKNKIFFLEGDSGKAIVATIARQIQERASEWRSLPTLPDAAEEISVDLFAATRSDGEEADSLRQTDQLTLRRAAFAVKLRDFEAYERDLPPEIWKSHREAFLKAVIDYVLVPHKFFELEHFLPRVIGLATTCEDFGFLEIILSRLTYIYDEVIRNCDIRIKALRPDAAPNIAGDVAKQWLHQLLLTAKCSIYTSFPGTLSAKGRHMWEKHMAQFVPFDVELDGWPISAKDARQKQARFFALDLAHNPLRSIGLPKELATRRGTRLKPLAAMENQYKELLPESIVTGTELLADWMRIPQLPHGFYFPTRPFSLAELFLLNRDSFHESSHDQVRQILQATRGLAITDKLPTLSRNGILNIPTPQRQPGRRIAVSSWRTDMGSWLAAVKQSPDPDLSRYSRLNHLLDSVIAQPGEIDYLILPELAVPANWFMRMALKLGRRGISLIAGIEYLHGRKHTVRNQVWAALSHNALGFPSPLVYRQDKLRAALHEEHELHLRAGLSIKPEKPWNSPPIIRHGDFHFALLVCSELTNIQHRAALRGNVDALFVPEWNKDTESFNALVESAALDVHAYIIQCNDREYGDSRIRAPHKDPWRRDLLRVKGGVSDYCVIGEIDISELRQFQSNHLSPDAPFKPVPDGFEINRTRRMLPSRRSKGS